MANKKHIIAKALSKDGKTVCFNKENPKEVVFISGLIPGEEALVQDQTILEIINPSKKRLEPPCPYFNQCGGCDLQFMEIEEQRQHKLQLIKHTFENYFKIKFPKYIDYSEGLPAYNYRKKVKFQVKDNKIGFFSKKTNSLVKIDHCLLLDDKLNNYIKNLNKNTSEINLQVIGNKVLENIGGFSQVNEEGNQKLIEIILKQNWNQKITEFYAGSGNFTFSLEEQDKEITAIEANKASVELAKKQTKNRTIQFICSNTEKYIKNHQIIGDVLLDPPREGAKELCKVLSPDKNQLVVYVSCNISTLGRDLKQLIDNSYQPQAVYFVDMFPQTQHIETVSILSA